MSEKNETVLRKTPLFANLTDTEMGALTGRVSNRHFERGALLFSEGEACTGLFLVASGKIRIFKLSSAGREQVLAVEGPGSSFAELPVFDGGELSGFGVCIGECRSALHFAQGFSEFLPRTSRCCAQSDCRSWFTTATPDRNHRRLVVYDGEAPIDRPSPAIGTGERNGFERGRPRGTHKDTSRPGGNWEQ